LKNKKRNRLNLNDKEATELATKLQKVSALSRDTMNRLTHSTDEWLSFLDSAAWLYKYPWHEQVMIYAQRPDATACAPIELWNSPRFKRWVNKGAKGIALIDDSGDRTRLRYVFDVSDTHTRSNIPFALWQLQEEQEERVLEELANRFGEIDEYAELPFSDQLNGIIHNAVQDNSADYRSALLQSLPGSNLEEYDEFNISVWFEEMLEKSAAYVVMRRLGLSPREYFEKQDFIPVMDFNTPATISQLGTATADISETILRQIERSVRSIAFERSRTLANQTRVLQNKDENTKHERSREYGTDIQAERRLSDSESGDRQTANGTDREIRENAQSVSEGALQGNLQRTAADGETGRTSSGDGQIGEDAGRTDRGAHGESRGRDGGAESPRSDEMGGTDEQSAAHGGGDRSPRGDLQLTPRFPTEKEQLSLLEQAEDEISSVFSVSQADFDNELCSGSGVSHGRYRIYAFYQTQPSKESAIRFLKKEYGIGGHSHTYLDGSSGFVDHDGKGITFSDSGFHHKKLFRWNAVHSRIAELIAFDRYLSEKEKASLSAYEQEEAQRRAAMREESAAREALQAAAAAMDEKRKGAQYRYSLGDEVQLGTQSYTVLGYDENTVTLSDPKYPLLSEDMPRDVFERRLRENPQNDHLIVESAEQPTKAPQHTEEETLYVYAVGDTVYLEGTAFRITQITNSEVQLLDPTLLYPVFRAENRETFHHLLEQDERNAPYMPSMPYRTVTEANVREEVPAERSEQPLAIEPTAFYPAERNKIPFDIEVRKLKPVAEQKKTIKHDFHITDDNLGHGGAKAKFRTNMDAINTLQTIELENRLATPEEQEVLSRYVGWGGIPQAFEEGNDAWASEFLELYTALSPEEYEAARASTLNAHYTSPTVIRAIYKCIENMGFTTGNVLEPSCGIGNFFGLLPENMKNSKLYGVELDPITGRIARQLYQTANIAIEGFEETSLPDSFFDLAIGNVPFGDYGVVDKRYDKHHFLIHDYFFAKTLDKVRPGGVVAFITSSGTMDKKNPAVRKYIAERAELLGAIRLPNNAFLANAGTGVVTDILFLQKRDRPIAIEPAWVHLGKTEQGYTINQYFVDHPDMVLGELTEESTQYGKQECTVKPLDGADLSDQLADAISNIHGSITEYDRDQQEEFTEETEESIPADPSVRNFSFTLVDGNIYYRENSRMKRIEMSLTAENRVKGMIEIRDCTRRLIEYQLEGFPDELIEREQQKLNALYDEYTSKYGLLNSRANRLAFSDDSSYPLLCSLEELDEYGNLKRKADMFTKRTIRQQSAITSVDTASEALALSIGEKAKVDMAYMSLLTGKGEEELFSELQGVIFLNPLYVSGSNRHEQYLPADEYLSGNVREKLVVAKNSATYNAAFAVNVEALEQVQPQDLAASEIDVRLGATWLPVETVQQFIFDLLSPSYYARNKIKVHYSRPTAIWNIENKNADYENVAVNITYGTKRVNAYKIIEETLNLKDVRVFDTVQDINGNEQRVLNKKETILAQQKQQAIKDQFAEWIWKDAARRDSLTKLYNEEFNSMRPREYDGSHIRFVGMNPEIALRQHQTNAVARILYGGNTLLGHVVGAGKTFEMTAAAMESKRLGLCEKSLFVVPNHLTEQWASEFLQLYPAANILVATKRDFETHNRKRFCSRIATGDYDAVIIGHSQFEKIPLSREKQAAILQEQIDEITQGIVQAKQERAERFTIKQMEKLKKNLKLKLEKLNDQSRKDDVITFEELGVDRLFVDEAHFYKNLFLVTKMRNVAGLSQTEAQKSSDLFMKCRYLDELTGGKGVVFATGTPISNSMTEMYTMQRYLQYDLLKKKDMTHFDAWASTFGETVTAIELAPEGTGYRAKTRFSRFYNLPELISMFKEVADIQTADMLNLPVPEVEYINVSLEPSEYQKDMVSALADRAEKVRKGEVEPHIDNMLRITNDGRKLALDQRLVNSILPDDESSKVNICAANIYSIWEKTKEQALTQLVFCDLSTPKAVNPGENAENEPEAAPIFQDVYTDLKRKLMAKGIPEHEIAFIHDAKTEVQKSALFSKVRAGQVRVLIGSTFKMGAGTNVQRKLVALHHLDIPWRPSDIEQREGRMIRQGNENDHVVVYRYVTKGTFDAYMWQTIENKQKFISQIMTSKTPVRSCEDIDEQALSYAEVKALAVDNPYIMEKMTLDVEVARLKLIKANYLSQKYALEDKVLKYFPNEIRYMTERAQGYAADIAVYGQNKTDDFPGMTLQDRQYAEKKDAGTELIGICKSMTNPEQKEIGMYRGFTLLLHYDTIAKTFRLTMKGTVSHTIDLGADVLGNIQRMENALSKLPERLDACNKSIRELQAQMENAKQEIQKPFGQEQELAEKTKRLAALDALLSIDKREPENLDALPEEQEEISPLCVGEER
jgi:N12 class adenine-specific DNA methylase